jgi:hypothetical protein
MRAAAVGQPAKVSPGKLWETSLAHFFCNPLILLNSDRPLLGTTTGAKSFPSRTLRRGRYGRN